MKRILTIAALALLAASPAFAGKVVVAANSSQAALDKAGVQAIFLGRTAQVGGQPAVVTAVVTIVRHWRPFRICVRGNAAELDPVRSADLRGFSQGRFSCTARQSVT